MFDLSRRRVFGPTRAGTGVVVRYETALPPARLSLPQTGQQLRWGRLDVHLVRDNRGVTRPRDGDHNGSVIVDIGAFEV